MGSFSSSPSSSGGGAKPAPPSNPDSKDKHIIPDGHREKCYTFTNINSNVADDTVFNAVTTYL